ncbi:hypothetical protein ACLE20_00400 [Rhizobium sp. YIM 134829]|uniref:hypothetical protein n=1 Tax=Rhizobium sp. YIM 134829 TaxID=3390453 RepID=UPI00397E65D2
MTGISGRFSTMSSIAKVRKSKIKTLLTGLWRNVFARRTQQPAEPSGTERHDEVRMRPGKGEPRRAPIFDRSIQAWREPEEGRMKWVSSSSVSTMSMETRMTNVIMLKDHLSRSRQRSGELPADRKAAILMFTGIRYERMDDRRADAPPSSPLPGANQKH